MTGRLEELQKLDENNDEDLRRILDWDPETLEEQREQAARVMAGMERKIDEVDELEERLEKEKKHTKILLEQLSELRSRWNKKIEEEKQKWLADLARSDNDREISTELSNTGNQENSQLEKDLEEINEILGIIDIDSDRIRTLNYEKLANYKAVQADLITEKAAHDNTKSKLDSAQIEIEKLRKNLSEEQEKNSQLLSENDKLSAESKGQAERADGLDEELKVKQKELEDKNGQIGVIQEDFAKLKSDFDKINSEKVTIGIELKDAKSSLESKDTKIGELETDNKSLSNQIAELNQQLESEKKLANEKETTLKTQHSSDLKQLRDEIEKLNQEKSNLEEKYSKETNQLKEEKRVLTQTRDARPDITVPNYEAERQKAIDINNSLTERIRERDVIIDNLTKEKERMMNSLTDVNTQRDSRPNITHKQWEDTKQEVEELKAELDREKVELVKLTTKNTKIENLTSDLNQKINDLKAQMATQQSESIKLDFVIEKLDLLDKEGEIDSDKLDNYLIDNVVAKQTVLDSANDQIKILEDKKRGLEEELEQSKRSIKNLGKESEDLRLRIAKEQTSYQELLQEKNSLEREKNKIEKDLQEEKTRLSNQINDLGLELSQKNDVNQQNINEIKRLNLEISSGTSQLTTKNKKVEDLETEIVNLQNANKEAKETIREQQQSRVESEANFQKAISQLEQESSRKNRVIKSLEEDKASLLEQNGELEEREKSLEIENDSLKKELDNALHQINILTEKIDLRPNTTLTLEQIQAFQARPDITQQELTDIKKQVEDLTGDLTTVSNNLRAARTELETKERKLSKAEENIATLTTERDTTIRKAEMDWHDVICNCSEKINCDLSLGIKFDSGDEKNVKLEKTIKKLEELLKNPDNNNKDLEKRLREAKATISGLQMQLAGRESLQKIKEIDIEKLNILLPERIENEKRIRGANSYQQLATVRQELIKGHCSKLNERLVNQRSILSLFLVISTLTIGLLIYKIKSRKAKK